MRLSLSRQEVEQLILENINKKLSANFNRCDISTYQYSELAVLTYEEPEQSDQDN